MNIQEKRERVKDLEAKVNEATREIRALSAEISAELCPLKVGDVIECRGKVGRVKAIGSPRYAFGVSNGWGVLCARIRKDGSEGSTFNVCHYDRYSKTQA